MLKLSLLILVVIFISCASNSGSESAHPINFKASLTMPSGNTAVVENGTLDTIEYVSAKVMRYISYSTDSSYTVRHKYVKPTTPVDPPVTTPPASGYSLTFENDFAQKSDLVDNQLAMGKWISDFGGCFQSYVDGTVNTSSGWRSEQQYTQEAANPTEGAIEWEAYYKDWKAIKGGQSSIQFHPNNDWSALLFISTSQANFNFARSMKGTNYYQTGKLISIIPNHWYKLRIEVKWSTKSDGYARLYIDGVLNPGYSYSGVTQDSDGKPYLKIGQNRWNDLSTPTTVLYKNLKVYKKN